jgi:hypothetical protein
MVAPSYRVQDNFIFGHTMVWTVPVCLGYRDVEHLNVTGTERRLLPVEMIS